jgi:predicted RNA-binding Zn-ribbon protein involved in translation (DUF1610 family)
MLPNGTEHNPIGATKSIFRCPSCGAETDVIEQASRPA